MKWSILEVSLKKLDGLIEIRFLAMHFNGAANSTS